MRLVARAPAPRGVPPLLRGSAQGVPSCPGPPSLPRRVLPPSLTAVSPPLQGGYAAYRYAQPAAAAAAYSDR